MANQMIKANFRQYEEFKCRLSSGFSGVVYERWAFTLIELLIVIGLLGAMATIVLSNLSVTRTEALDHGIVQKELSDIQRAFQRFESDCIPQQSDYKLISRYGLGILCKYTTNEAEDPFKMESGDQWSFDDNWDVAKNKGWRGPYIMSEGKRKVNTSKTDDGYDNAASPGQVYYSSGNDIPILQTPYSETGDVDGPYYYRVLARISDETENFGNVLQLYVVAPKSDGSASVPGIDDDYPYRRKLLLNGED